MSKSIAKHVKLEVEDTLEDIAKTLRRAADNLGEGRPAHPHV